MIIDRVEVSENLYKELLTMDKLNKQSVDYNKLFDGVKIVINEQITQGYRIIYK